MADFREEKKRISPYEVPDVELTSRMEHACQEMKIELSTDEANFIIGKLDERTPDEAQDVLKEVVHYHSDDMNLEYSYYMLLKTLSEGPEANPQLSIDDYNFAVKFQAVICSDWSPYAEVRAATSVLDDPDEPAETIRMYVIGIIYANVGALIATFFANRYPSISLNFLAIQLIIYPTGRLAEYALPDWGFKVFGRRWSLNPGPWSFKEQMLATQMMSAVDGAPFAHGYITVLRSPYFFNEAWAVNYGFMIVLSLVSTYTGYGIAGLLRGLLVYPVKCVWFNVLPFLSMNRTLTKPAIKENVHGWTIGRFPFLLWVSLISFCWYWITDLVFQALQYFSWMTWISPKNVSLAAITGVYTGLGLNPIPSFDWNVISGHSDVPCGMVSPWYSSCMLYLGQWVGFFVIVGIYFSKSFNTQYLPINAPGVFDNTGLAYNTSQILGPNGKFNREAYNDYSPAFLSAGTLIRNGARFAIFPASIVYALLYYRSQFSTSLKSMYLSIRKGSEKARRMYTDPFCRNLEVFPEVPEWWFGLTILLSITLFIVMVEVFRETDTPVWTVFFCMAMNLVFIVPIGLLFATTNTFMTIGLLIQILIGYMIPHNANAMLISQCIASNFWEQAQNYISNQKQTHYARIPSRALFRAQYVGSFVTIFTTMAILRWQFTGIKDYCDPKNPQKFTCLSQRAGFATYVMWGTLGPDIYLNGTYTVLKYSFLIGAFVPLPFYVLDKWKPAYFRRFHPLVLIFGCSAWAPSSFFYTTGNFYLGFVFNYFIRKHYLTWWRKYNYILYAAMGTGVAWAALIVFFAAGYKHLVVINWWGNWVHMGGPDASGADYNGIPLEPLPAKGYFGPDPGHFPQR